MASNHAFQWLIADHNAITAIMGFESGKMILKIIVNIPAPSATAASSIETGKVAIKLRVISKNQALVVMGSINDHIVL